jgi:hypothetical protein
MNQIYPDEGLPDLLEKLTADDLVFHLFTNDIEVNRDVLLEDFVEETTFDYEAITVPGGGWTGTGVAAHVATAVADTIAFTPDGGDWDVYGYYVTDVAGETVLFAARFDGAPIAVPDGDPLLISPTIADFSKLAD